MQDSDNTVPFYSNRYARENGSENGKEYGCDCGCDTFDSWKPSTDIYNTKDNVVFKVELPGVPKEDVKIEVKESILTISGQRQREKEYGDAKPYSLERCNGKFYRAFRLPKEVDASRIDASMKDGILELRVAKPEETKPRQIQVNVQ